MYVRTYVHAVHTVHTPHTTDTCMHIHHTTDRYVCTCTYTVCTVHTPHTTDACIYTTQQIGTYVCTCTYTVCTVHTPHTTDACIYTTQQIGTYVCTCTYTVQHSAHTSHNRHTCRPTTWSLKACASLCDSSSFDFSSTTSTLCERIQEFKECVVCHVSPSCSVFTIPYYSELSPA